MGSEFGRCPRVLCQGQSCLPIGLSDQSRLYPVSIYCPACQDIFFPRSSKYANLDGAYFGTTFAHLFLLQYSDLVPQISGEMYVPKIFGFRINRDSEYHMNRFVIYIVNFTIELNLYYLLDKKIGNLAKFFISKIT